MEQHINYAMLDLLNGTKKVVLGNHEKLKRSHNEELLKYVNCVCGSVKKKVGIYNVWLTHIPIHEIEFEDRVDFNIHGHIHFRNIEDVRYINVCPEHIGYAPKELGQIVKQRTKKKLNNEFT